MTSSEIQKSPTLPTCPASRKRNSLVGHVVTGKARRPHARPLCIVRGRGNPNWLLPSRLAPASRSPTQLVASSNRRWHTFWYSHRVDQGSQSWTHRDWVYATDLCRLCDLMMMMMMKSYEEHEQYTNIVMWTFSVEAFRGIGQVPNIISPSWFVSQASFVRHWHINTNHNFSESFFLAFSSCHLTVMSIVDAVSMYILPDVSGILLLTPHLWKVMFSVR